MPSKTDAGRKAEHAQQNPIDSYFVGDDFEDPFASSEPDVPSNGRAGRPEPGGLGIDEEVSVKKSARAPRVKLDESR